MRRWRAFAALVAVLVSGLSAAQQSPDADLKAGLLNLEEGRVTLAQPALTAAQKAFDQCLRHDPKNSQCQYALGEALSYRQLAYSIAKDKNAAHDMLEQAIPAAEKAVELNPQSSDAYAQLADLYGQKAGGGMFAGMKFGPKSSAALKRAMELAPQNPRVQIAMGRFCLFAPKAFGGDVDKAVESFRRATELDPKNAEADVWLALALRKQGKPQDADAAIQKALQLDPRSGFAKAVQRGAFSA